MLRRLCKTKTQFNLSSTMSDVTARQHTSQPRELDIFKSAENGDHVELMKIGHYPYDQVLNEVNDIDPMTGYTPLQIAVKSCHPKCVSILLQLRRIEINKRTADNSKTALHLAVTAKGSSQSLTKVVQMLLNNGADMTAKVENGPSPSKKPRNLDTSFDTTLNTVMRLACAHMPHDVVELLLNHKAGHVEFKNGLALYEISIQNDNIEAFAALAEHGNLANIADGSVTTEGDTNTERMAVIVSMAAAHKRLSILKYLFFKFGVVIKAAMVDGWGDKTLASAIPDAECLSFLLENLRCDPCYCTPFEQQYYYHGPYYVNDENDEYSFHAVSKAIEKRVDLAMLETLLDHVPEEIVEDFNVSDLPDDEDPDDIANPVYYAARADDKRYMDALVQHGFDPKMAQME